MGVGRVPSSRLGKPAFSPDGVGVLGMPGVVSTPLPTSVAPTVAALGAASASSGKGSKEGSHEGKPRLSDGSLLDMLDYLDSDTRAEAGRAAQARDHRVIVA